VADRQLQFASIREIRVCWLFIRVHPYYYPEKFAQAAQMFAAKERKEHKEKLFHLCVLCVLLRLSSLVAASAALGLSVVKVFCHCIVPA